MTDGKDILNMKREGPDEGEIRYVRENTRKPFDLEGFLAKAMGMVLAIGACVLFFFLFVYVILPIIAILLLWSLIRSLFRR